MRGVGPPALGHALPPIIPLVKTERDWKLGESLQGRGTVHMMPVHQSSNNPNGGAMDFRTI